MVVGKLHSIETMGLLDGPGIRTVFFLQGCPLRCAYCHNPDSQSMFSKETITPEDVLKMAKRYKSYYNVSGGGVTFSGGEPLMQGEFLIETLKLLKAEGIHTAVDTSGFGDKRYFKEILELTDLVLLDIKHYSNDGYIEVTDRPMKNFRTFLTYLNDFKGKVWFRHVMVPTITDDEESIYRLFNNVAFLANKIDRFEILPYHIMGVDKYRELGMEYRLKGISEMNADKAKEFEDLINSLLEKERNKPEKRIG